MSKKATRIFQEQANIEKILLKNISEYRPTGDEDFWFDMGIRVFDAENEYEDELATDYTDDTDDDDEFNTNYREWS